MEVPHNDVLDFYFINCIFSGVAVDIFDSYFLCCVLKNYCTVKLIEDRNQFSLDLSSLAIEADTLKTISPKHGRSRVRGGGYLLAQLQPPPEYSELQLRKLAPIVFEKHF